MLGDRRTWKLLGVLLVPLALILWWVLTAMLKAPT